MKTIHKIGLGIAGLVVVILLAGYISLAFYYRQAFCPNTWINGVYCTGKTAEQVSEELLSKIEAPVVVITDSEGNNHEISLAEADYRVDYLTPINAYIKQQNSWMWIENVFFSKNHEIIPRTSYNEQLLKELFEEIEPIKQELQQVKVFVLGKNKTDGYRLYDCLSHRLDTDMVFQELLVAIEREEFGIDMGTLDCYYDIPLSKEQEEQVKLWEKIEAFQQCGLVYDMGEDEQDKLAFTPAVMAGFLATENGIPVLDENGSLMISEEAVVKFVADLCEIYDTYGKEREFQSTRGDIITLSKGTHGTTIDQKAEVDFLMENLLKPQMHTKKVQSHIPEYKRMGTVRGKNDIGDTYIEVDMTNQKLYFYVDGKIEIETDVVTGNERRRMSTPEGVNYVYNMQKNRVLRGPGYASPVKFWMPVNRGIGIHDANWRSEFGGDIYKTDGSHGCINVPPKVMPEIYELAEIGTPVVMYY